METLKSLFSSNIIGNPEKIKKILLEFNDLENQMINSGYGVSAVAQGLQSLAIQHYINEKQRETNAAINLAVSLYARYMILSGVDNHFFSFTAANDCHRAIFNVGCKDENLRNWLFDGRKFFGDSNLKNQDENDMPVILREELLSILQEE